MGIASIARYSLAMIQRSSDSAFASGIVCGLLRLQAALFAGSCVSGCSVCGWLRLKAAVLFLPIECQIGLYIDWEVNCKTEYQFICNL